MSSKKNQRAIAIQQEKQKRYDLALDNCPISRKEYEELVAYVCDKIVENGSSKDWYFTSAYLSSKNLSSEKVMKFLLNNGISDDWSLMLDGDSHNLFGPSANRNIRMPIEKEELENLLDFLNVELEKAGCDHSFKLTRTWLENNGKKVTSNISALMALGGFCDCEVVLNVEIEGIYKVAGL